MLFALHAITLLVVYQWVSFLFILFMLCNLSIDHRIVHYSFYVISPYECHNYFLLNLYLVNYYKKFLLTMNIDFLSIVITVLHFY